MASSCTNIPTLTTTIVQTTSTPSTTLTTLTTTLPPTESLVTTTICNLTSDLTCASSTIVTSTTTIPGATQTLTNTISTDVPVTISQTSTLFSQSCTTTPNNSPTPPPPPPSNTSSTTSTTTSEATSVLPNGSTTTISTTITNVIAGNPTVTSPGMQSNDTGGGGGSSTPKNLGAIIGGAVGGFFGLAALVLIIWFILKRRKRWDDIFDHDEALGGVGQDRRFSLSADLDAEPKPYQYGLVGLPGSSPGPHNSPPLRATQLSSESSYGGSATYSGMATDPHQQLSRGGSFSPLNLPPGAVATGMQAHTPSTMSGSRPSTAGSIQPLTNTTRPISQHGLPPPPPQQQQGVYQQQYPPAMQQYYQQHQRGQSSMTAHSATPSLNSPPLQPLTGWMMNTGVSNNPQLAEDLGRSGSPMSYQEPRRLQIANYRDSVAPSSPIDEESPRRTSMSTSPGGITPFTAPSGPLQKDGKGRLRTSSSGNVVVHSDAGRVQQSTSQPASSSAPGEPAPPAYSEQ